MKDAKESLSGLLAKIEGIEATSMTEKLRAMIEFTNEFVPEMGLNPTDEFLIHIGQLRQEATQLLADCGRVSSNGKGDDLPRVKNKFSELKGLMEYLCVLRSPEAVEQAHEAL